MTSRMQRQLERDRGADQAARGFVGDPLRLPFARILQEIQSVRMSEAFRRFVQASAAALTHGQQEAVYLDAIKGLPRADLDRLVRAFQQLVVDMDDRPHLDLLGPLYMEISHKLDRDAGGEFFTPHSLSVLLARLNFSPDAFTPGEILLCNEPTAGTGGMVLATAQVLTEQGISPLHTRWIIQDISSRSCWAAYINATLWGIPAHVVCGNTLTLDYRWQWTNPFWHQARPWPTAEERREQVRDALRTEHMVSAVRRFLGAA